MAGPEHHDPISDNIETHPVKLAVGIVIGTVALIVGIVLLAKLAIGLYGARSLEKDPIMTKEAVEQRIAPVAKVAIDPNAPKAPPAAPAAPAPAAGAPVAIPPPAKAAAAGGNAGAGKTTYDSACMACHATGVAGAPKLGDKAAWAPRVKSGKDSLYASALKGKGAMPPKGGNMSLSDDAVRAAVDFMLSSVK